jgi:hypothetical protein
VAQGDLVDFALSALSLVEGAELRVMLAGTEGGLEEGGAQEDGAAFAHFGLPSPLTALLQTRVVAHEGLEAGGGLAPGPTGEDLIGEPA